MLKQIRHLVGYDLRALRLPLVVWGLVLAVHAALLLAGPARLGIDVRLVRGISYDFGILVVRLALTAILVALVIQRDALVGTTVFWRTRPIARHRLLASKISSLFLVVVFVPWLLICGVLLALGLPPAAAARGATSVAAEQALVALFALAAAALTANLAHFVIAGFAGLTLVMTFLVILPYVAVRGSWLREAASRWSADVFTLTAVTGALAAIVYQFLRQRTGRSAAVMAGALVVATAGGALWHPVRVEEPARPVDPSFLRSDTVVVGLTELGWSSRRPYRNGVFEHEWALTGVVGTSGEPDGILLMLDSVDLSLRYAGETIVEQSIRVVGGGGLSTARGTPRDQPYLAIGAALGGVDLALWPNAARRRPLIGLATVSDDVVRELTGSDGILDARVRFRAYRYAVTARTGVSVGRALVTTTQHSTVTSIGPLVRTQLVPEAPERTGVDLMMRSTGVGSTPWFTGSPLPPTGFLLLRNEARRQAALLIPWGRWVFRAVLGLAPRRSSVDVWTGSHHLEFDVARSAAAFDADDEWLRGAELLLVEPEYLGTVTRPLHLEGVPAPGEGGGK